MVAQISVHENHVYATAAQAQMVQAAIRIAAAQRESSDIRSELEAEHTELIDRVRALQTAVVGMLEHGAARSPDLAAVLEPEQDDPPVEAVG